MATLLRAQPLRAVPAPRVSAKPARPSCISFRRRSSQASCLRLSVTSPNRFARLVGFASEGETKTEEPPAAAEDVVEAEAQPPEVAEAADGAGGLEDVVSENEVNDAEDIPLSPILASLQVYKEALANGDESTIAEIGTFFKSIEDEKLSLELKVATLSAELSTERERVLRIGADFDNFRKRTDRERLSLVTNAQGELVESLLPMLDNFERAKSQIKVGTEAEEKINNSYQSIYKQFMEILSSLGVVPVEPKGNPFDPLLHEAIMREESTELEEGIVLEEYRKGFKLGDRLLRPSMVKVSAGPGPAKPEQETEETESASIASDEGNTEAEAEAEST